MDLQTALHSFSDRDTLVGELATTITNLLSAGVTQNGQASLAVSGGSTPVQLFESLSKKDVPWKDIDICLVDERWVAPADSDSNEHLVRTHLLQHRAEKATFTGMWNAATTASEGEAACAAKLGRIHRPFDVLILGMGGDGHTASLFPGAVKLSQATDLNSGKICMGIAPVTAPHERMTLTLPAILDSKQIILHVTGQDKKDVLEQAFADGPAEAMPIRFVLQNQMVNQRRNFSIYWAP